MSYQCAVSKLYRRGGDIFCFRWKKQDGLWAEKSTGTRNRKEALTYRAEFQRKLEGGAYPNELSKMRLDQAEEWFLSHRKNRVGENTMNSDRYRMAALRAVVGNKRLNQITSFDLTKYQNARLAAETSPHSINKELQLWSQVLAEAKLWRLLRDDYRPLRTQASNIGRALTRAELVELIAVANRNPEWLVAMFCASIEGNTGLRGIELKRLRLANINLELRELSIEKKPSATTVVQSGAKTASAIRRVPLNVDALRAVSRLIERQRCIAEKQDFEPYPDHYLLPANMTKHTKGKFKGRKGFDLLSYQKTWDTAWSSLTEAAGFKGFRQHDLRHTFITHLVERGVSVERIMAMVGHISSRMVRHYTHIATRVLHKDVALLDAEPILQDESVGQIPQLKAIQ
jgi:integrase